jgi:hypothetical protein
MQRVQVQSENLSGDDIVCHLGKLIAGWSPRCLQTKLTHLLRLQSFLNEHVQGSTIHDDLIAVTMGTFLDWVHEQATAKERKGDGTRAAQGAFESLNFFRAYWGFNFQIKECRQSIPGLHPKTFFVSKAG